MPKTRANSLQRQHKFSEAHARIPRHDLALLEQLDVEDGPIDPVLVDARGLARIARPEPAGQGRVAERGRATAEDVPDEAREGVRRERDLALEDAPDGEDVPAGDGDGRCLLVAPSIALAAVARVLHLGHAADVVQQIVL